MTPKETTYAEFGTAIVVLTLGSFLFVTMESWINQGLPSQVSPLIFPRFVLGLTLMATVVLLVTSIRQIIVMRAGTLVQTCSGFEPLDLDQANHEGFGKGFVIYIAILVAYYLAFEPLGFLVTTPLVMLAVSWMLGGRRIIVSLLACITFSIVMQQTLLRALKVALPEGILAF